MNDDRSEVPKTLARIWVSCATDVGNYTTYCNSFPLDHISILHTQQLEIKETIMHILISWYIYCVNPKLSSAEKFRKFFALKSSNASPDSIYIENFKRSSNSILDKTFKSWSTRLRIQTKIEPGKLGNLHLKIQPKRALAKLTNDEFAVMATGFWIWVLC